MQTFLRAHRITLGLFVLGALSAGFWLGDDAVLGRAVETVAVARSVAGGAGFSNPYDSVPTGPTALVPPVWPAIMAGVIVLFGYGPGFAAVLVGLQMVLNGLQAALLPAVSERLLGGRRPGYFAAGALICLPVMPIMPQYEMGLHIVVLLLLVLVPVTRFSAAPAALLAALALHINPSSVFLLAGWLLWKRPGARWLVVWVCTLALASLPWAVRNYAVTGRLVLVRNNLPLELRLSNNEHAAASFIDNLESYRALHPNNNAQEAAAVVRLGETAYFDRCGRLALDWIRQNPHRFAGFTLQRTYLYWAPRAYPHRFRAWMVTLLTLLALGSLGRIYRNPVFAAGLFFAPLLYFAVQADYRYRLPYLWLTLLAAGLTVSTLLGRLRRTGAAPTE